MTAHQGDVVMLPLCALRRGWTWSGPGSHAIIISAQKQGVASQSFHIIGGGARRPSEPADTISAWGQEAAAHRLRSGLRASRISTQLDEDEEEQVYALEPSEKPQGGTCHQTFMLELLSNIYEFEVAIPDSKQDPPWCGDGDRFFVDNQDALAQGLAKAHTAWDAISGSPCRTWSGSLVGMAFAINAMKDDELFGGTMSKADYDLLFQALFPGLSVRMVVRMTSTGNDWPDFYTQNLYPRDFRTRFFGPPL